MRYPLAMLVLVTVGLVTFEVIMRPSAAERTEVAVIFGVMAVATVLAAVWIPKIARSRTRLRTSVILVAGVSFMIVALGLLVSAQRMFVSDHDLQLFLVVLIFGVMAASAFAVFVSQPMTRDLEAIAGLARRIASGTLAGHTGVERSDEVGTVSEAVDAMAGALRHAAEMRERDEEARRMFFAAVGHDLRTPLASLRAAVEALEDDVLGDQDRLVASIERDVAALSRLVDDLFTLARLDSGESEVRLSIVDLTELADEAIEILAPVAAVKGVRLRLVAQGRVSALAGEEEVGRVLRNVVDNAIRHSPAGGPVAVEVRDTPQPGIVVTDEGPGFPADFVDRAFDRFSRFDAARERSGGGAGLGLAIARSYVEAMGGRIAALPGPGGRVEIILRSVEDPRSQ